MQSVNFLAGNANQPLTPYMNDGGSVIQAQAPNFSAAQAPSISPEALSKLAGMMQGKQIDQNTYQSAPIQGLGQIQVNDLPPIGGYKW
jgi:hypothetical protein